MQILIGTTNPSKVQYFEKVLEGADVTLLTLRDVGVDDEPEENGETPQENAAIKARFYARYAPQGAVICADSGLYLDGLGMDDPRQPGLHVRTPGGCSRLNDEQMIDYYAALAHELGGQVLAYYLDGAAVVAGGTLHTFQETREEACAKAFYLVDTPSVLRREGWPIDSISKEMDGRYFLEPERPVQVQQTSVYKPRLRAFLLAALGIEK